MHALRIVRNWIATATDIVNVWKVSNTFKEDCFTFEGGTDRAS